MNKRTLNVLIGCESSSVIKNEFLKLGHNAWSCDFLPAENPKNHYQCDLLTVLDAQKWDLLVAHPSCQYLCNSGVSWLYKRNKDNKVTKQKDMTRWVDMVNGAKFFKKLLDCDIPRICLENPIPHKYALAHIGRKYDQIIQPWQYGHTETKATCLWLKGLPKLAPTSIVEPVNGCMVHKLSPGPDRWKIRSRTYDGIGKAIAKQFSKHILNEET